MKNQFLGITGISIFILVSCFSNVGEAKNGVTLSDKNQSPIVLAQRDNCNIFRHTKSYSRTDILIYSDGSVYYRAMEPDSNDILVSDAGRATRENDGRIKVDLTTRGSYDSSTMKLTYFFREVSENGRSVLINQYDNRFHPISGSCRKSDFLGS